MNFNFNKPAYEWNVISENNFLIQLRAWRSSDEWIWNVYAYIYEGHPLFAEEHREFVKYGLPFHGGCTFDLIGTTQPLMGIKYTWQRESKYIKVGCDYNHYEDERFNSSDPREGVPWRIQEDVKELYEVLKQWSDGQEPEPI